MNEDMFYDEDFTSSLGLGTYKLEMGYYWIDVPLLRYYSPRGSRYISSYSTGLNLPMVCAALNAKTKEYYSSQDTHPMTRNGILDGRYTDIPPLCFTVRGPGYTPVCVLRDEPCTLPIKAAEILNLRVIDHLEITKDTQWEVVKTQGRIEVRLVRDSNGYTISRGSLFLPVPSIQAPVPNTPHFSFSTKTKGEEVVVRGRLEECFMAGKPDMLFRYDMGTDRIV